MGAGAMMMGAQALLQRAGWTPGRRVGVDDLLSELVALGHGLVPPVRDFLAEFSGLVVTSEDGRRVMRIGGHEAAQHADPEWCSAYAEGIGRLVTPVGEYSHMTLLMDETGAFWGGLDADYGFMGEDIVEVVDALLVQPGSRRLNRIVAD